MLRCRMTGGELTSEQLMGLASLAELYGGGYADVTTRANFQIREIPLLDGLAVLRKLLQLEIVPPVEGGNNLRNVTVTPTTGFDSNELYDVYGLAQGISNAMLYHPALQGLPGKFNIAVDSGGSISVASEANDIGLKAVNVDGEIYFRVTVAEIKGESTLSQDCGWLIHPEHVVATVSAMVAVFLEHGDFSQRLKSRLKYLIKQIGMEKYKHLVAEQLLVKPIQSVASPQTNYHRIHKALGLHKQKQEGFVYLGIAGKSGRLTAEQLRQLALVAKRSGNSSIRLTTKQTCIIPHIHKQHADEVLAELESQGLTVSGGNGHTIVACTGNQGCVYSATDTKSHASELSEYLSKHVLMQKSVNIHFTGCPFSCAQNRVGDIGLLGCKIDGKAAYHVFLGGNADFNSEASKIFHAVPFERLKPLLKQVLEIYEKESSCGEVFHSYLNRAGESRFSHLLEGGLDV